MKNQLILGSFLALTGAMTAQNVFPTGVGTYAGIGTTSPSHPLDIQTGAVSGTGIRLKQTGSSGEATFRMDAVSAGGREYGIHSIGNGWGSSGQAGSLMFRDEATAAPRLVIGNTGNVGVGLTNPTYKLEVT